MSTERHGVCVLEFDAAKQQLVTRATGDVAVSAAAAGAWGSGTWRRRCIYRRWCIDSVTHCLRMWRRACAGTQDPIGLGADCGQICSIDPQCRMIALHLIAGVLKVRAASARSWVPRWQCVWLLTGSWLHAPQVIPITAATRSLEAFNVRLVRVSRG